MPTRPCGSARPAPPGRPQRVPFLLQGDAAWSLIANLTSEDAEIYLKNRHAKGFNAVLVNLIEHKFAKNAPRDIYGEAPFRGAADLSAPNEKYFQHADWVIRKAAENGLVVLLAPVYLGYPGLDEGFYDEVMANGPEKCLAYGRYLGQRYRGFDNIIWVMGATETRARPGRPIRERGSSRVAQKRSKQRGVEDSPFASACDQRGKQPSSSAVFSATYT